MNRRQIEEQLQDLVDGTLGEPARQDLLALLKRDPGLLETYCAYAELESALIRIRAGHDGGLAGCALAGARRVRLRAVWIAGLAAAAALVFGGVVLRLVIVPDPRPSLSLRASPGAVVEISHAPDAADQPEFGKLVKGSRAVLAQGSLELVFDTGVRAIVQGPADFILHDENRLRLREGVAWFDVPAMATGFTVETPALAVTDLGTEFGLRTRPDCFEEVHVFKGMVEVQARGSAKAAETLVAGMARAVGATGRLGDIPPDRAHFLSTLPASLPYLHWNFDDRPGTAVARGSHPAAGRAAGRLKGLENSQAFQAAAGRFGRALAATGAFAEARSGWAGVQGSAPRTVAHWIKLGPGGSDVVSDQVLVGWGCHALTPANPNPAFLTFLRRVGDGTMAGVSFGAYHLTGTTPLEDGRWHHFAVVYSGRALPDGKPELACYLDGRLEPMNPAFRTDVLSPEVPQAYSIRTTAAASRSIPVTLFPGNWSGEIRTRNRPLAIDELFLFEAALSQEQVHSLHMTNQPP
jgi:hypothetical protein